jgi:hypothetical protein
METWMKVVWAFAAVLVVGCLWALATGSGGASNGGSVSAPAATSGPEYFTQENPARSTIEHGVRENGETTIYNTTLVK